jgi:hypothetical protein
LANIHIANYLVSQPEMTHIRTLKPNVTREEAIRHFSGGMANGVTDLIRGQVRSLAELYIPFRLFQVKICSAGREQNQTFALDAVCGVLDLYQLAAENDLLTIQTRNVVPVGLDISHAQDLLIAKVRRMIYTRGFFRVRDLKIDAIPLPGGDICVPYWVAFRGSGDTVQLAVLDAVRRRPEGAKVRRLVEDWLRSDAGEPSLAKRSEIQVPS